MWQKAVATWQSGSASVCDEPDQKVRDFKAWKCFKTELRTSDCYIIFFYVCVYLIECVCMGYEKEQFRIVSLNDMLSTRTSALCWCVEIEKNLDNHVLLYKSFSTRAEIKNEANAEVPKDAVPQMAIWGWLPKIQPLKIKKFTTWELWSL